MIGRRRRRIFTLETLYPLSGFLMVHKSKPLDTIVGIMKVCLPKTLPQDIVVHLGLALTPIIITCVISRPKLWIFPSSSRKILNYSDWGVLRLWTQLPWKESLQGLNCFHAGIGEKVKQARTFEGNLRFLCLKFEFQRQEEEVGEEGHWITSPTSENMECLEYWGVCTF